MALVADSVLLGLGRPVPRLYCTIRHEDVNDGWFGG